MTERVDADVVVVGAGMAGLEAARRLHVAGRRVVVLEARDRSGGRVLNRALTGTDAEPTVVEMGGQWIGPTQHRVNRLVEELGLETFPTYNDGEHLLDFGGRQGRYRGTVPHINPLVLVDMGQAQARLDRNARRVPLVAPWSSVRGEEWDSITFETWIRRTARTSTARELLRLYCTSVFAAEPRDVSFLHVLHYTHSGGSVDLLAGTRGGAQQDRIVGGSQRIPIAMAASLPEGTIRHRCPVRRIEQRADRVTVLADGVLATGERVVVAVPPTLAGRISYTPALPSTRDQLTQRMPAGSVIKVHVVYDEPFWRADGLTGQSASDRGPIRITFDNSPPSGRPGVLVTFFEADEARRWTGESRDVRREAVLGSLTRLFGPRAARAVGYEELDWSAEEWTRGCYGAHLAPGVWTRYGPALRAPVDRIHWAGAETATVWSGYMDGALQSGERCAQEVLEAG